MPGEFLRSGRGKGSFISSPLRILRIIAGTEILYKQVVVRMCKTCIIMYSNRRLMDRGQLWECALVYRYGIMYSYTVHIFITGISAVLE